jgi:predicted transcriptional regulator
MFGNNRLRVVLTVKKPLLDVIFASEKRKKVLLFLKSGPKEMDVILEYLNTTRQALLPQMRTLEEHHLLVHYKDTYELTDIGKLIVDEMIPLLSTVEILDVDVDYWGSRKLDFIPTHLLKRLHELGTCKRIDPTILEMYEIHDDFYEASKRSTSHFAITAAFHPHFPSLFRELISNKVHIYVIMSSDLCGKLRTDNYTDFAELMNSEFVHFFVHNEKMDFLSFMHNDYCMMISPLRMDGEFDNKHIRCCNPDALIWGKYLFEYYKNKSVPLTEVKKL